MLTRAINNNNGKKKKKKRNELYFLFLLLAKISGEYRDPCQKISTERKQANNFSPFYFFYNKPLTAE